VCVCVSVFVCVCGPPAEDGMSCAPRSVACIFRLWEISIQEAIVKFHANRNKSIYPEFISIKIWYSVPQYESILCLTPAMAKWAASSARVTWMLTLATHRKAREAVLVLPLLGGMAPQASPPSILDFWYFRKLRQVRNCKWACLSDLNLKPGGW
jgi:hypothetical protein